MDNINFLEEIGLAEVSRKTHIEITILRHMINKEFSKLGRINTMGFVKILKREYDLNLDSWLEEFDAYWQENNQVASLKPQESVEKKSSVKWLILVLLVLIAGGLAWYFVGDRLFLSSEKPSVEKPVAQEVIKENKPIKNELKEPMEDVNDVKFLDTNDTNETHDTNSTDDLAVDDTNVSQEEISQDKNESIEEKKEEEMSEVYLEPKRKIWVGIVDLETRKKRQYTTSKVITINLNKPQIILMGHKNFTLVYQNGKEVDSDKESSMYYYVDHGTITKINKKEFITYNGGKSW